MKCKKRLKTVIIYHCIEVILLLPEAHIFPSTQKNFVYSLVNMLNGKRKHTCSIATHSPYIMTAFNNVILAGEIIAQSKVKTEQVEKVMPKRQTLRYGEVAAFEMKDERVSSINQVDTKHQYRKFDRARNNFFTNFF